jgi:hypothetical protein
MPLERTMGTDMNILSRPDLPAIAAIGFQAGFDEIYRDVPPA